MSGLTDRHAAIARCTCLLRAARLTRLAQRAHDHGNIPRSHRLAHAARQLLSADKNPSTTNSAARDAAPASAGSRGNMETECTPAKRP